MDNHILLGLGDNPAPVVMTWLATCAEGHPQVTYIAGVATTRGMVSGSGCPVCAAFAAMRAGAKGARDAHS